MINTHNGIKEKGIPPINIEEYPAIKAHLDKYWDKISKRADKGDTPYNLRNCAYMDDFDKQKIVWKRIGSILRFSYDDNGCLPLDSICFATGSHIKFLTAFLNSKVGNYLLQGAPKTGTGDLLISVQAVSPIKVPAPDVKIEREIEKHLDVILCGKNKSDKTRAEEKVEEIANNLYHFTKEEQDFIKNSLK